MGDLTISAFCPIMGIYNPPNHFGGWAAEPLLTGWITEMHRAIRTLLGEIYGPGGSKLRILYGGSVKPGNCRDLLTLDNVDGALIGGASLNAAEFLAIAAAYR